MTSNDPTTTQASDGTPDDDVMDIPDEVLDVVSGGQLSNIVPLFPDQSEG